MKTGICVVAVMVFCSGCLAPTRTEQTPTAPAETRPLPPAATLLSGSFATGPVCAECHSNHPEADAMRDRDGTGSYSVEVDLWYQTLGARYVAELFRHRTPEVDRFRSAYETAGPGPVRVAVVTTVLNLN